MVLSGAVLTLAFFSFFDPGSAMGDFVPRCRAGICDDRPECPLTSCTCIFPSQVDCAVYYQCVRGKPVQYRCSPGLLLNPLTLTCDYDFNVNCSIGKTSTTVSSATSILTSPPTTQESTTTTTVTPSETTTEIPKTTETSTKFATTTTQEVTTVREPTRTTTSQPTSTDGPTSTEEVLTSSPEIPTTTDITSTITKRKTTTVTPTSSPEKSSETTTRLIPTPGPSFICPEYYGLFPDPNNCRRFYHCSHGIPYHKWCPSNLHFNPHLLVCDWPYHAGCESFPSPGPPITVPPPQPTNGTCDCDCCIIPVSSDCRSFILCINGQPFLKQCEHGLYFNPMTGTCDKPENVECKPEIQCPADDGRFPFPDSCSYFVECHSGVKKVKKCPEGLNYDDISQTCDWSGTCQGISDPPPTPLIPLEDGDCPCNYCFERDPQDCSSYLLCKHQRLYKGKCADGLLFNEITDTCDYDYNVKCPVTEPPSVYCPEENGYFPYPGQCGLYMHCVQGNMIIKECPGNLHFDPHKKHCEYPWNAGCSPDLNPTPTPGPTPSTTACGCDCCIEPDPEDCSTFTICIDKVGIRRRCSSGLLFNPLTENCDFEENVQCIPPTDYPVPECSESEGLVPYPDDCNKYFQCINGHLHNKSCPSNLHFNPQKKVCDWPEKAGCSGGPTVGPPTVPPYRPCDICESCYIPHKYDCAAYIYCNNGSAVEMTCSEGLFFNPDIEDCDIASHVNCPGLPTDECPEASGLYPTDDCSTYILCSNGVPYRKRCPPGLYFNVISHTCDWPENVDCGAKPTPPPTPSPIKNCSCDCCFVPDENDCSKFYLCLDNIMTEGHCSEGLRFNRETENCDFAGNVDCEESSGICQTPDGLFPNPDDCSTYYVCSNGVAKEETCPQDLHFSKDLEQCERPCIAMCDNDIDCPPTTTSTITTTAFVSPYCKDLNGFSPNPTDCGSFYQCSNGHAYLLKCPNGLHFSEEDTICERPCDALCDLSIDCTPTTTSSTTTTTPKPVSPYCKEPNGLNPNPDDCGSFYQCSNGNAYLVRCPNGLHFSAEYEVCERPCDAQCDATIDCKPTTTSSTTTTTTPKPVSPYCKELNGFNPNPDDCSSFYQCSDGNAYLINCPNGLHFNAKYNVCERPCDAQCDLTIDCTPTTTSSTTTTTPKPVSPYCKDPNGLNPNPDDCGSFYQCSNGNAYLVRCPNGLHFSAEYEVCERPCDAQCDATIDCKPTTTSSTTTTTTPKPVSPYCKEMNGINPNPDDCASFYQCSDGNAYLINCTKGLHFNAKYNICEQPCDAQCDLTIDCSPTTTTDIPVPQYCKHLDGLNPNPDDCGSFYYCSNGESHLVACPEGLHFNREDEFCERPCDAKCDPNLDCPPRNCSCEACYLPDPVDCSAYYFCEDGRITQHYCPYGLLFNKATRMCDYEENVECVPTGDPSMCSAPDGVFPFPGNCHKYVYCENNIAYVMSCSSEEEFDYVKGECRDGHEYCGDSTVDPHCHTPTGLFPHESNCSLFYHCDHGVAYLKDCPKPLFFNPQLEVCDWPRNVDCGHGRPDISPHCLTPTGLFPHESNCSMFYHCDHGIAYLKDCPKPLYFNPQLEVCDWPRNVDCGRGSTGTISTSPSSTITEPDETPRFLTSESTSVTTVTNYTDSSTVSVSSTLPTTSSTPLPTCDVVPGVICPCACRVPTYDDCSTFYQCKADGTACKKSCPLGLYFNKRKMVCDLPTNVECRDFYFSMLKQRLFMKTLARFEEHNV